MIQKVLVAVLLLAAKLAYAGDVTIQCWEKNQQQNWNNTKLFVDNGSRVGLARLAVETIDGRNGLYFGEYKLESDCFVYRPSCRLQISVAPAALIVALRLELAQELPSGDLMVGVMHEQSATVDGKVALVCKRSVSLGD